MERMQVRRIPFYAKSMIENEAHIREEPITREGLTHGLE
jgi:hypothetical protein